MSVVFQTGFRPFFLVAAVVAAALPLLWVIEFTGAGTLGTTMPGVVWHAHEMLLGFTSAVVAGFLLTAVRNWTQRPTLDGAALAALVGLWVAGRVTAWAPVPPWVAAAVDFAFFAGLAVGIGRPLAASRNVRNAGFVGVVLALGLLDAGVHLLPGHALTLLRGALDAIVVVMVVITGRIVPLFTGNALPDATVTRSPTLDKVAIAGAVGLAVGEVAGLPAGLLALPAWLGGAAVVGRAAGWAPRAAFGAPMLAILHAGHLWLGAGLLLRAADLSGLGVPPSVATHALTAGAVGTLTLGMMARVALGHTGRPVVAGRLTLVAFGLITAAAVVRVAGSAGLPTSALWVAAVLYGLAFLAWVLADGAALLRPRPDGRPG